MSDHDDVKAFTKQLGLSMPAKATMLQKDVMEFRFTCLREEIEELEVAYYANDMPEVIDALIDLMYFAHGTLALMGVDYERHWKEVHEANMRKQLGKTKRGFVFDASKPEDWIPPNHKRLLCDHDNVATIEVGDTNHNLPYGVFVDLIGQCDGCESKMIGTARVISPGGELDEHQWSVNE